MRGSTDACAETTRRREAVPLRREAVLLRALNLAARALNLAAQDRFLR